MTVTDIADERCKLCRKKAVHHRLTPAGRLYCLELAGHAHPWAWTLYGINPLMVYRCPVSQLQAGEFAEGIGVDLAARMSQ